jgi:hypothetical protein
MPTNSSAAFSSMSCQKASCVASLRFLGQPIQRPSLKVPSTLGRGSRSARATRKISSRADAQTHRHRYLSMPAMPKGNSSLPCQPARLCTMGLFVMINQRTKDPCVCRPLCQSQRIGSPYSITSPLFAPLSIVLRHPVPTNPCVKDGPVFS